MTGQHCEGCEHFSPAQTCIEKPTWGYCTRVIKRKPDWGPGTLRPLFTWADNHCDDFQVRVSSSVRRD